MEHPDLLCNIQIKQLQHPSKTLEIYTCNIHVYPLQHMQRPRYTFCNIQIKHLQHSYETAVTCIWNTWNTYNMRMKHLQHSDKILATCVWNTWNISLQHAWFEQSAPTQTQTRLLKPDHKVSKTRAPCFHDICFDPLEESFAIVKPTLPLEIKVKTNPFLDQNCPRRQGRYKLMHLAIR